MGSSVDRVEVFNEDVKGVRLSMGKGALVAGGFFLESAADVDLRAATVGLTTLDPGVPSAASGPVRANGSFDFSAVHNGAYALTVSGLPGDLYVKQSLLGGVSVLESGVEIRGRQSDSLAVVIGLDGGNFSGTVLDGADKPASNVQAVLAPVGERRRRTDQFRAVSTDSNGRFAIHGIPPGEYKLYAWEYVEPNAYLNAGFLARYEEQGVPVRVSSGENAPVSMRTIPVKTSSGAQ